MVFNTHYLIIKPIKVLPLEMRECIPKNKFIVGYTGSLSIAYGIIYLLKAARELKNEEIHFIIIGSGPEKQDLINFVEVMRCILLAPGVLIGLILGRQTFVKNYVNINLKKIILIVCFISAILVLGQALI